MFSRYDNDDYDSNNWNSRVVITHVHPPKQHPIKIVKTLYGSGTNTFGNCLNDN